MIMLVDWASASFLLLSIILLSSLGGTMFAIIITTNYKYCGSCLMVIMTLRSRVWLPSRPGYSKVAMVSLRLYWRCRRPGNSLLLLLSRRCGR